MRGAGARRMQGGSYTNPCLTMHQPWASLLVHGIKRIEGRSWPAPITGRLWIHAASKVPDEATIKAMEEFYREIYAVDGITDLKFPENYPVSRLIGCVQVVGCLRREELVQWKELPEGVRLEGLTDLCWLCEQPQKLIVPFEMRGYQGVYNLEKKIYEAAVRGLVPAEGPLPIKFPLPNPKDPFSLKPGSISSQFLDSETSDSGKSSSLHAAIAGARAASLQFSKKEPAILENGVNSISSVDSKVPSLDEGSSNDSEVSSNRKQSNHVLLDGTSSDDRPSADFRRQTRVTSKLFAAALRELRPP